MSFGVSLGLKGLEFLSALSLNIWQLEVGKITTVRIEVKVDRPKLLKTFNALCNLVEIAGEIKIAVDAQSEEGFDRHRIRIAVKEALEESGIELKFIENKNGASESGVTSSRRKLRQS